MNKIVNKIKKVLGAAWCLIVHGIILGKHKHPLLGNNVKCEKCGRHWEYKLWL